MLTVATKPGPILFDSSARQGADVRVVNRMVNLNACRAFCILLPTFEDGVEFVAMCIGLRTVTTNLLVWVESICGKSIDRRARAETNQNGGRAAPPFANGERCTSQKTHLCVMKFPRAHTFLI
jgi:hypothetical protein